jgi:hypothetical protein
VSGLERRLRDWLKRRHERALMERYGGIQWCPWCRQCAQTGDNPWSFKPWDKDGSLDVLTCSVCTGTSVWLWALGMIYMHELDPPKPAFAARTTPPSVSSI